MDEDARLRAGAGERPPSRLRRWLAGRTLRWHLIVGLMSLLAFTCVAVGAATYLAVREFLVGSFDQTVVNASRNYSQCLKPPPPGEGDAHGLVPSTPAACGEYLQGTRTLSAVVSKGQITSLTLAGSNSSPALPGAGTAVLLALLPGEGIQTRTLAGLGSYRLLAVRGNQGRVYISGLPMSDLSHELREFGGGELIMFSVAVLLTGLLGAEWVRLSLRPLRRMAGTAARVAELPLADGEVTMAERVPVTDPRTEAGQVGAALNRLLGHVEAALARRAASEARLRRFAADASHELRTPLAAIRGYAELARRHRGPVPEEVTRALSRVEAEAARMSILVDELLLLARLAAGHPLARDPVDLTLLVIDATSGARVTAPGHQWQLKLSDEVVTVRGDEYRLRQVVANLLSNAARHTPPGTTVTLALERPGRATEPVTLRVADNGPGIPAGLLPALFERFTRGDASRSPAPVSTGLGLAIVHAVATAHGGSIRVSSKPGLTEFVLTIPGTDEELLPQR